MLRRRSLLALTGAALVLSAAVGAFAVEAFGGARPIAVPDVESGALPLLPKADEAAMAWRADAYLVGAAATEGKPLDGRVDPPFLYDTSPDPLVGNGRSVAWTFAYASPGEPAKRFFATVGGDGALLYQRALADPWRGCCVAAMETHAAPSDSASSYPAPPSRPPPLARVSYDADEAVSRVVDHPAFAGFAEDHPVFQAFLELTQGPEGRPAWSLSYRTATFFSASALVDATTGDVLHVDGWPREEPPCCDVPPRPVPPEPRPCCAPEDHHAKSRAALGPSRPEHRVGFPVDAAYAREIRVRAEPDGLQAPLADDLVLQVYDGMGRPVARAKGTGALEVALADFPGSGTWSASLMLTTTLREAATTLVVDVLYDDVPRPPAAEHLFQGAVYGMGGQAHLPLHFDGRHATALTLSWDPVLLREGMELAVIDEYGNEILSHRAEGTGSSVLSVEGLPERSCCLTALVRSLGRLPMEQPFELLVEMATPWAHDHVGEAVHPHH